MLNITNVYVQYGDRILLNRINLTIGEKDKVGLVGRNGAGKSTLLKIIAGEMSPHEGKSRSPNMTWPWQERASAMSSRRAEQTPHFESFSS